MATKDIFAIAEFLVTREKHKKNISINTVKSTNLLLAEMENRLSNKFDKLEVSMASEALERSYQYINYIFKKKNYIFPLMVRKLKKADLN